MGTQRLESMFGIILILQASRNLQTAMAPKIIIDPCTQSVRATAERPPNHSPVRGKISFSFLHISWCREIPKQKHLHKRTNESIPTESQGEFGSKLNAPLNAFFKAKTLLVIQINWPRSWQVITVYLNNWDRYISVIKSDGDSWLRTNEAFLKRGYIVFVWFGLLGS